MAFVAAQAAVLLVQQRRGARCFVPASLLPPRYDYHRPLPPRWQRQGSSSGLLAEGGGGGAAASGGGGVSRWARWMRQALGPRQPAATATAAAAAAAPDIERGNLPQADCAICMNAVEVGAPSRRMVTPCEHFFHPHCLRRWMDIKLECPTCRRPLPPP